MPQCRRREAAGIAHRLTWRVFTRAALFRLTGTYHICLPSLHDEHNTDVASMPGAHTDDAFDFTHPPLGQHLSESQL